jgi:S-adenosyl methyltransferase
VTGAVSPQGLPTDIDTTVPHTARVWNYWLGGKDNYAVDRAVGDEVMTAMPDVPEAARQDRAFMNRAIGHLTGQADGVRQFLDIGTGLPTANNTHEVAQAVAPESAIVYVDNDPLIMAHARALLTSSPAGRTAYIHADLRAPDTILAAARETLDFDRPIAISMLGVLNHILGDEAYDIVGQLTAAVPTGSYLVISHPTAEVRGDEVEEAMRRWNEQGATPIRTRTPAEIARFFHGFELLEPGLVSLSLWRPNPSDVGSPEPVHGFGAVGRKL